MRKRLKRLGALTQKEMIQLLRDRRTLGLLLALPILELFLFAYAVDLVVDHIPTAVADMSLDARSQAFVKSLATSGYFDIEMYVENEAQVIRAIDEGRAKAGVVLPPGMADQIERGSAQVLIIFDGSDSFTVQSGFSAATSIAQTQAIELMVENVNRMGLSLGSMPITSSTRVLYNPTMNDLVFIVPGLAAILLQLLTVNLTAQSVVREYELGTIEQLLATPVRPIELMLAKMAPNIAVSAIGLLSVTAIGVFWFGVPFRGNPWLFAWLAVLYIISGLGLGLLVSTLAQTQKQSQQLTTVLLLLSLLLTGFIYPRATMPPLVLAVGDLIPLTYFIRIIRAVFTKGVGLTFIWGDVLVLAIYGAVVLVIASTTFKKRLD